MATILFDEAAEQLLKEELPLLCACIEKTLEQEGFPLNAEVSLSVANEAEMKALNCETRGIDRVTDVLSFPMLETEDGVLMIDEEDIIDETVFLGDIVICLEKAKAQAEEYGHSIERELGFLTVHSMLHLLGYDHEEGKAEESEMFARQEEVLSALMLYR